MENFTIHIFGYGETQFIEKDTNIKYRTENLKSVQPLVDAIWSKRPTETDFEKNYNVIHIFSKNDIRWLGEEYFNLKDEENLIPLIDRLITEITTFETVEEPSEPVVE
jgi:hypothetical protein